MLSQIESEQRRPSLDAVELVARAIGCSPILIYLLATNGLDLPPKPAGLRIVSQISRLADDLWRHRRTNRRNGR